MEESDTFIVGEAADTLSGKVRNNIPISKNIGMALLIITDI